jgi:hypothetical protein
MKQTMLIKSDFPPPGGKLTFYFPLAGTCTVPHLRKVHFPYGLVILLSSFPFLLPTCKYSPAAMYEEEATERKSPREAKSFHLACGKPLTGVFYVYIYKNVNCLHSLCAGEGRKPF